ncbi:probable WRKY transcription factor 3 isoform X2 [Phalaenopsis equestris]|uniref:probable WRKY transcription factor 3 isoform X2 n=1 Tax=Phalaenopsis equestris TaxID=78828 RepID=UPI0009E54111|nr:probable WRKY transcription factor 3 isoform X2 [Phalaenopsis equestris]
MNKNNTYRASLRKSTEQLASSSNAPPIIISETAVPIKPKAVRLKPSANHTSDIAFRCDVSVQAASLTLDEESVGIGNEKSESIVLYRPIAQPFPSSALLKKFEDYEEHKYTLQDAHFQSPQAHQVSCGQPIMNLHQSLTPFCAYDSKKTKVKSQQTTNNGDQNSSDGYNWRKYGQKHVKGIGYPRAYYRCTHPCCSVKKMVEKSKDGEISEIVYRGEHNHPKPQKIKQSSALGLREQEAVIDGNGRNFKSDLLVNDSHLEDNFFENKTESCGLEGILDDSITWKTMYSDDSYLVYPTVSPGFGADCRGEEDSEFAAMDGFEKKSPERKHDDNTKEYSMKPQKTSIPKVVASINCNHPSDDGYHWRKYGQKVVKGNSFPRNYYRCTNQNCRARKYVERASDDPASFITTYEGDHKH